MAKARRRPSQTRRPEAGSDAADRATSRWERLNTPVAVIAGVVGVVATILGVVFAVWNPFSSEGPPSNPAAFTAYKIDRCMKNHDLTKPLEKSIVRHNTQSLRETETTTFQRCDWPPAAPQAADGYTRVIIRSKGLGTPAAERYTNVDQILAPCGKVRLTFVFSNQGGRAVRDVDVERGEILDANTDKPLSRIPFPFALRVELPGLAQIVVLRNLRYTPINALCVRPPDGGG